MIKYENSKPTLSGYKKLYESTGWVPPASISDEVLQTAIDSSFYWISAYDDETLVGIGRIVSDGALYAFVCDLIVEPEYQKRGIGASILGLLKEKCKKQSFRRVWLFAATGKAGFYLNNGFEIRPDDAPGMQMK